MNPKLAALALACTLTLRLTGADAAEAAASAPRPAAPFLGTDYSGVYDCQGQDHQEGPYTATVTLTLVPAQSTGRYGAYGVRLDVPGYGTYLGQAAADGADLAIHFALSDPGPRDYGTGLARVSRNRAGKLRWQKYYYEPEFKGGNFGTETCTQR